MSINDWKNVSKTNLCQLCGKPDWCSFSPDKKVVLCHRTTEAPTGWKKIKESTDGYPIYAKDEDQETEVISSNTKPRINKPQSSNKISSVVLARSASFNRASSREIFDKKLDRDVIETCYQYHTDRWIKRLDWVEGEERKKTFRQWHRAEDSRTLVGKGDIPWELYRQKEVESVLEGETNLFVLFVEGEKCVDELFAISISALTLQGSSWGKDAEITLKQYQKNIDPSHYLILLPDNDDSGRRKMDRIYSICLEIGLKAVLIDPLTLYRDLPEGGDCVDIIEFTSGFDFRIRLTTQVEQALIKAASKPVEIAPELAIDNPGKEGKKADIKDALKALHLMYPRPHLEWNELKLRPEFKGVQLKDLEHLYLKLEIDYDIKGIGKEKAYDLLIMEAKKLSYHPVKRYLESVENVGHIAGLDNLASKLLATKHPLYDAMVKAHLIGSVKRIYEPGCKKDEALVLQGKQGLNKSSFFSTLYGEDFFSDSLKGTDRDSLLILHQYWCLEMAEIETITGRKEAGELKAFISSQEDTFRAPYAKSSEPRKRQSVLVGSVNPANFLQDDTGNRRFWVIPVKERINLAFVRVLRDAIWSEAIAAYKRGELSYLTYEQEAELAQLNTEFNQEDAWEPQILEYLKGHLVTTIGQIADKVLDFELAKLDKRSQHRIASILKTNGWERSTGRYLGKVQKIWVLPSPENSTPSEGQ